MRARSQPQPEAAKRRSWQFVPCAHGAPRLVSADAGLARTRPARVRDNRS
jgi:hypothetical protein